MSEDLRGDAAARLRVLQHGVRAAKGLLGHKTNEMSAPRRRQLLCRAALLSEWLEHPASVPTLPDSTVDIVAQMTFIVGALEARPPSPFPGTRPRVAYGCGALKHGLLNLAWRRHVINTRPLVLAGAGSCGRDQAVRHRESRQAGHHAMPGDASLRRRRLRGAYACACAARPTNVAATRLPSCVSSDATARNGREHLSALRASWAHGAR